MVQRSIKKHIEVEGSAVDSLAVGHVSATSSMLCVRSLTV
jgi:hypothetical protein